LNISDTVFGSFGIVPQVAFGMPKIMVLGNNQIFVEDFTSIADYKKESVKLVSGMGLLEFCGEDFEIVGMQDKNIIISGRLKSFRVI